MELWDKEGNFLGSVDKAKKVHNVLTDELFYMRKEIEHIYKKLAALEELISKG